MAQTPEGKVKALVKKTLDKRIPVGYTSMYTNWPVPAGYGTPMLDLVGCYNGLFFAVETKAPGKKPTPRQEFCIEEMRLAGAAVFVIDGPDGIKQMEKWLDSVDERTGK